MTEAQTTHLLILACVRACVILVSMYVSMYVSKLLLLIYSHAQELTK